MSVLSSLESEVLQLRVFSSCLNVILSFKVLSNSPFGPFTVHDYYQKLLLRH